MRRIVKAQVSEDLYNAACEFVSRTSGVSLSSMVRMGLETWLEEVEAEAWECRDLSGVRHKAAGDPYPQRTGEITKGRPLGGSLEEGEELVATLNYRLPPELDDRVYNAIYWRNESISRVTREALEGTLRRYGAL